MQEEEPTSGIEEIIDWDILEELMAEGAFGTKADVIVWLETLFLAAGTSLNRPRRKEVIDGLAPEFRAMYRRLPNSRSVPPTNPRLTEAQVREMRARYASGEPAKALARAFGVGTTTANDIVNNRTWKEVA